MPNSANIGNYIERVQTYLEFAKTQIEAIEGDEEPIIGTIFNTVEIYTGTSFDKLFDIIPTLSFPAAIVLYTGSSYGNLPRRTGEVAVLVINHDIEDFEVTQESVTSLMHEVIKALDHEGANQYKFTITGDRSIDFEGCGLSAIDMRFEVEDY